MLNQIILQKAYQMVAQIQEKIVEKELRQSDHRQTSGNRGLFLLLRQILHSALSVCSCAIRRKALSF